MVALRAHSRGIATLLLQPRSRARRGAPPQRLEGRTEQGQRGDSGAQGAAKETRRGRPFRRGGPGGGDRGQPDNQQPGPASGAGAQDKGNRGARGALGGPRGRAEGAEERMSSRRGLGRLYDRLSPEERFRLDVLALARGDEEESERLTATCPRRDYTMNDLGFVGRWEAARELGMCAYVDVVRRLDKIRMIDAFR